MKKRIKQTIAFSLTFALLLSGCAFSGKKADKASEDSSAAASTEAEKQEEVSEASNQSSVEINPNEIIVVDNLEEPDLDAASEDASFEPPEEIQKYPVDKDLVCVFFGDSQIANGRNDGSDIPRLVSFRVPNASCYNLGIGGTTASLESNTSNYQDYENWTSNCFVGMAMALAGRVDRNRVLAGSLDVLDTMNHIDPGSVDYYFIEYGANDFFAKVPLDKYSYDGDINEIYTYYGALKLGIEQLKAISPNAKFILITPFYGIYKAPNGDFLGDTYVTSNGIGTLADYAKKMQNIAEETGYYCLDTMYRSKCDLYLDTADQYLMDNLHLSLRGRQIFARLIAHIPNSMEHYEPTAYRQTEYIEIEKFDPEEYYMISEESLRDNFPDEYESYLKGEYLLVQPPQQ